MEYSNFKKYKDKKIILAILSILIVIVIICISSFLPLLLDPTQFLTLKFLTNTMITIAICIFGTISCVIIGQSSNELKDTSKIVLSKREFELTKENIKNYNYFSQWVRKVLQKNDLNDIKNNLLKSHGITIYENYSYLDLEISQIKALLDKSQKFNDHFYMALTKEQIEVLVKIKSGKIKVHFVEPIYYLVSKNNDNTKTISERSGGEGNKKTSLLVLSLGSKIIMTILVAMVFSSLVPNEAQGDTNVANQFYTLFSRLFTLLSSAFMGYSVGCQMNDIDASFLELKTIVLKMYLADKTFIPLNEEELAKADFIERVKKENEESMKLLSSGGVGNE